MDQVNVIAGVLLEDAALTLEDFARACAVEQEWVVRHVQAGLLGGVHEVQVTTWRFTSPDLRRARDILAIERDFDAGDELAALVVDLTDEVRRLKSRLRALERHGH
ncbi:MerR family transcriptional regulator [Massilia arenosa]|uniref:MerR family transcriptional regulator n=1 Tax=Zemynaea arenosa TaxID=2561931 RepID=A0A4Y9SJK3_9BURK|nr:chaperone modulator CbpM [Massilia arenosa]TFW25998.1 MerR family transcriptional regulator [Massilia arenosa]